MFPPDDPYYWVPSDDDLREDIEAAETLASELCAILPRVFPGLGIAPLQIAIRNYLCCEFEQRLRDSQASPATSPDDLYEATERVESLRASIEATSLLFVGESPDMKAAANMVLPLYKQQLRDAEKRLAVVQAALDLVGRDPAESQNDGRPEAKP